MQITSFKTIATEAAGLYKEKGSKFLSFAYPVESEEEVKEKIEALKKQYFDARHHCFAFMLGADKKKFRAFDDGEPNHSAGDPILGQIRSRDITNVLVVVVRYFGGTKLGVGGLITAYKLAAADALDKAPVVEKEITKAIEVIYDYSSTPEVMKLVKDFDLIINKQSFEDKCSLDASVGVRNESALHEKLALLKTLGHISHYTVN